MQQFVECNNSIPSNQKGLLQAKGFVCCNNQSHFSAALYIMVHFSMFLLLNFIAVSAEKSSSLHTTILRKTHKRSDTMSCITTKYIFLMIEIRYFILLAINTHIDRS